MTDDEKRARVISLVRGRIEKSHSDNISAFGSGYEIGLSAAPSMRTDPGRTLVTLTIDANTDRLLACAEGSPMPD